MKKKLLIAASVVVIVTFLILFYYNSQPVQIIEYDMYVNVSEESGDVCIKGDTDELWFGRIPPSTSSKRTITLKNLPQKSNVKLSVIGELDTWTKFKPTGQNFVLEPSEVVDINVVVSAPFYAESGEHTSKFRAEFHKISMLDKLFK